MSGSDARMRLSRTHTIDCSRPTNRRTCANAFQRIDQSITQALHTRNTTLFVTVDANASAKPAVEAEIEGETTTTSPVTPTTTADRRLNRADNQRFTERCCQDFETWSLSAHWLTSPHPVVRVRVLQKLVNATTEDVARNVLTVSTQRSMSRRNFDDAPNARTTVTPAIVSP